MLAQGLSKHEILRGRREIDLVFNLGKKAADPPLLAFYLFDENLENAYAQVLFAVPKKNLRRAVDRNLMKRRMKEAYRMNKHILAESGKAHGMRIAFLYTGRETVAFSEVQEKIILILQRLAMPDEKAVK